MSDFYPHLEILPEPQRLLWDELATLPEEFTLYGGTALALHLGHRESIDFDFFSQNPIDPMRLLSDLAFLKGAKVLQTAPNSLTCQVSRDGVVKLSFFGLPGLLRLAPSLRVKENKLKIASLLDLSGTKISVIQLRAEAKDYLDIDALLKQGGMALKVILAAGKAIYGNAFNPQNALKALTFFDDGNLRQLPDSVKKRLVSAACSVDLDDLPELHVTEPTATPETEPKP